MLTFSVILNGIFVGLFLAFFVLYKGLKVLFSSCMNGLGSVANNVSSDKIESLLSNISVKVSDTNSDEIKENTNDFFGMILNGLVDSPYFKTICNKIEDTVQEKRNISIDMNDFKTEELSESLKNPEGILAESLKNPEGIPKESLQESPDNQGILVNDKLIEDSKIPQSSIWQPTL